MHGTSIHFLCYPDTRVLIFLPSRIPHTRVGFQVLFAVSPKILTNRTPAPESDTDTCTRVHVTLLWGCHWMHCAVCLVVRLLFSIFCTLCQICTHWLQFFLLTDCWCAWGHFKNQARDWYRASWWRSELASQWLNCELLVIFNLLLYHVLCLDVPWHC